MTPKHLKPKFQLYSLICLLSIAFISESVGARTFKPQQIAQQQSTQPDATEAAAKKAFNEGMTLYKQGTAESLRQAIVKWEQALELWSKVPSKAEKAKTLVWLGKVHSNLGENQKALEFYNQALLMYRAVGDKQGEATTFNNIGSVYSSLGEKQKALSFFNQALPMLRAVGDKQGEAITLNNIGLVYSSLGEKQKALSFFNQALPMLRAVGDKRTEAITLNNIGAVYSSLGKKQKALEFYNQALLMYRAVGDKGGEATTLTNIGSVYSNLGEKQKALEFYNQALPMLRAVGDKGGEAGTLNNIGLVYDSLGEKQKALEFYNQALPLKRAVGDKGGEATTLNNIGSVYDSLGEKQKALEFYNQALPMSRAVGDKGGEATTLNNIGSVYDSLGEKQKALEFYNQALPMSRAVGDKGGEATTLTGIGIVYSYLGEKQKALEFYNQALPMYRAVGDKGGEAATLTRIGSVYDHLGEKQKALEFYNQALPMLRAVGDKGGEAGTLNNIGLVYSSLGEKQKALSFYNQALPIFRAVGDKGEEAATLNNIGLVYSDLGEKQKALEFYNQALPISRAVGDKAGEATTLNNIGSVYSSLGEKHKALEFLNQALPIFRAVGDKGGEATTLWNIAFLERSRGNLAASRTNIKAAINIIEDLRQTYTDTNLKTTYFATVQGYYKFYIDLLMELHKKQPSKGYNALALHISERSRARVLLELLTEARADIRKGADPELLKKEKELQTEIDARKIELSEIFSQPEANQAKADELKRKIDKLESEYKELQISIKSSNPKYGSLKYPDPLTLPQIQQQLDKDTILLQYSLGEKRSFLWAVTPTSVDTYELPSQQEIEKAASSFHTTLQQASANELSIPAAKKLSQMILSPVADKLPGKRLVIVADGGLQTIPFAALADVNRSPLAPLNKGGNESKVPFNKVGIESKVPFNKVGIESKVPFNKVGIESKVPFNKVGIESKVPLNKVGIESKVPFNKVGIESKVPFNKVGIESKVPLIKRGIESKVPLLKGDLGGSKQNDSSKNPIPQYQPLMINHEIVNLPSASTIAIQRRELANRKSAPKALAILADPVYGADDERVTGKPPNTQLAPELETEDSYLKRTRGSKPNAWDRLPDTATEAKGILNLIPDNDTLEAFDFDANYTWATSSALNQFRIIHFATHGFVNQEQPEKSGLVLSLYDKKGTRIKGYLELKDLFNQDYPADLIVLSACETGLGKQVNGEGLVGLTRGLMYAGGERVVLSLWQVSDTGTSALMQEFYQQMLNEGKNPVEALRAAQRKLWEGEKWRSPYYWAGFTVQGEWRED